MFRQLLLVAAASAMPALLAAQYPGADEARLDRSGPRFGMTVLPQGTVNLVAEKYDRKIGHAITQFGWQVERQYRTAPGGPVALTEFVLLVGGTDQGLLIPSVTWLVGIRTISNFEIGVGPNGSPSGLAIAMSVGQTFSYGGLAIPLNVAVVPSSSGTRVSVLTGFNLPR